MPLPLDFAKSISDAKMARDQQRTFLACVFSQVVIDLCVCVCCFSHNYEVICSHAKRAVNDLVDEFAKPQLQPLAKAAKASASESDDRTSKLYTLLIALA